MDFSEEQGLADKDIQDRVLIRMRKLRGGGGGGRGIQGHACSPEIWKFSLLTAIHYF